MQDIDRAQNPVLSFKPGAYLYKIVPVFFAHRVRNSLPDFEIGRDRDKPEQSERAYLKLDRPDYLVLLRDYRAIARLYAPGMFSYAETSRHTEDERAKNNYAYPL